MSTGLIFGADTHSDPNLPEILRKIHDKWPDDHLAICGDLTDDATKEQYSFMWGNLIEYWGNCSGRFCFLVPGNHDCYQGTHGINIFPWRREGIDLFDRYFGTHYYGLNAPMVWELPEDKGVVIGLDSNCENYLFSAAAGRIGLFQRRALDKLLNKYRGWARIVMLHHHYAERGILGTPHKLLDADKFMRVVSGRCEALVCGHLHKFERLTKFEKEFDIPDCLACGALVKRDYDNRLWRVQIDSGHLTSEVVTI